MNLNLSILNAEIQEFINAHLNSDSVSLLLKGTVFKHVKAVEIVEQIEAKKKCKTKLPTWFNSENIYYPNKLNIEQTSSEITAQYKTQLVSGNSIIDITGGFGVDCFYFAKQFKKVVHCEINEKLSDIVKHNYARLNISTVETVKEDGLNYLKNTQHTYDWIYIDPSRRSDSKEKVFLLKDCFPNIPGSLEFLFKYSKNILMKTSPLLDISAGLNELQHVKTIHVIAVNNEVKELLWILKQNYIGEISMKTVNIKKEARHYFNFNLSEENRVEAQYSLPLTYLYQPNGAVLKAGGFQSVANQFSVFKLHKHTHLYTSQDLVDFPGRCFKIEKRLRYNKKIISKEGISKANISARNFPESVSQIKKKLNIKDGGTTYLFFTTDLNNEKIVLVASRSMFKKNIN